MNLEAVGGSEQEIGMKPLWFYNVSIHFMECTHWDGFLWILGWFF